LAEIRLVHVVEVGFQVHESRWQRIQSVVGQGHGLRVFHFREGLEVEAEVALRVVALRGRDVGFVCERLACPETDTGVMAAFRDVVVHLPLVLPPAEFAGDPRGEFVGECQEDLGAEGLQEGAPGLAGQGRAQRADALGGDDGNALGLAGEGEKLLVATRIVLAYGGEVLILVADKKDLTEVLLGVLLDIRDAVQNRALEVEFHHDANGLCQSWVE
jgi:hypothetical protein